MLLTALTQTPPFSGLTTDSGSVGEALLEALAQSGAAATSEWRLTASAGLARALTKHPFLG
jgi:hypothetical protein